MADDEAQTEILEDEDDNFVWTNSMGVYVNLDRTMDGRNLSRREKRVLKRERQREKLNKHQ